LVKLAGISLYGTWGKHPTGKSREGRREEGGGKTVFGSSTLSLHAT
jgi:hypothetical protein